MAQPSGLPQLWDQGAHAVHKCSINHALTNNGDIQQ